MNKKTLWITGGIVFVAIILITTLALYSKGYRMSFASLRSPSLVAPGQLQIVGIIEGDTLHINKKERQLSIRDGIATTPLPSGLNEIIISRTGFFPYAKTLDVQENLGESLQPLMLPLVPVGTIVSRNNAEGEAIHRTLINQKVPTMEAPKRSDTTDTASGDVVTLYATGTMIIAHWNGAEETTPKAFCTGDTESGCGRQILVTNLVTPIDGLDFYPGRNDVIVFSTIGSIFAMEMDTRPIQNFQPIYTGEGKTKFSIAPKSNTIFILGTSTILSLELPQ